MDVKRRVGVAAVVAIAGAAGVSSIVRLARRSGVADADLEKALPGDELVLDPIFVADRAAVIDAPPGQIWPWLVQLGKGRAGWYMPMRLERLLPGSWRGARTIDPRWQTLAAGDRTPDYGPGAGEFETVVLDPPRTLVQYSVREPSAGWTWPEIDDPVPDGAMALTWVHILEPLPAGRTRLHVRLRATTPGRTNMRGPMGIMGGLVDWLTIALLFRGLQERVRQVRSHER